MLSPQLPLIVLAATFFSASAFASPLPPPAVPDHIEIDGDLAPRLARRPPRHNKRLTPQERQKLQEKVRKRVDTFVTVELATELELDQKTALQLLDAWRAHRDAVTADHQAAKKAAEALSDALKSNASDAVVKKRTEALRTQLPTRNEADDLLERARGFLTVRQQAKLLLAYPQIQREVRKMMRRARKHRDPPAVPSAPHQP